VLAGEIQRHGSDLEAALRSYQSRMKPYASRKQRYAEGLVPSFVPNTALGVQVRDFATLLMRLPAFPRLLMGRYFRDAMKLPDYDMPPAQKLASRQGNAAGPSFKAQPG
jgi:2-polyprenyl-6-methoxyphenol hydroxylase-like FAD-dependent oxidoreductase